MRRYLTIFAVLFLMIGSMASVSAHGNDAQTEGEGQDADAQGGQQGPNRNRNDDDDDDRGNDGNNGGNNNNGGGNNNGNGNNQGTPRRGNSQNIPNGRASSYINRDTGAATENPDVNAGSNCFNPDRFDRQQLSPSGTATRNVHNDACFLDSRGNFVEGPASFQSFGVGSISACPDPDGAGPKFAVLSDTNGDGRNDLCFQSGYQDDKGAGDEEFHARLNNTTTLGTQQVVWCSDADMNGCGDERNKAAITIEWTP